MATIKRLEEQKLRDIFATPRGIGYVFDFSDASFSAFFEDEFGVDIDAYEGSKARRLLAYLQQAEDRTAARVLRRLWEHHEESAYYSQSEATAQHKAFLFKLVDRLESGSGIPSTDAFDRFVPDETLDHLVASIERDISAGNPEATIDRLHTYCMKKMAYVLTARGLECGPKEPLNARVGKYVRALQAEHEFDEATLQAIRGTVGFFDKLNSVRNHRSLAHDNILLAQAEARYLFETTSAMLRLFKAVDTRRFGA